MTCPDDAVGDNRLQAGGARRGQRERSRRRGCSAAGMTCPDGGVGDIRSQARGAGSRERTRRRGRLDDAIH